MSEWTPEIVQALLSGDSFSGGVESEIRALRKKSNAINDAIGEIYRALSDWTGVEVTPSSGIPTVRDGKVVGKIFVGFLGVDPVREIAEASLIEDRGELQRRSDNIKSVQSSIVQFVRALSCMTASERARLSVASEEITPNALTGYMLPLETRILREMGMVSTAASAAIYILNASASEINKLGKEIETRRKQPGRPRNEAAHSVALKFAKLYARVTGNKPTYSAGPDGFSGEFTPALRLLFDALGWAKVDLRGPATKAIQELSDDDFRQEETTVGGLLSTLLGD